MSRFSVQNALTAISDVAAKNNAAFKVLCLLCGGSIPKGQMDETNRAAKAALFGLPLATLQAAMEGDEDALSICAAKAQSVEK